MTTVLVVVAHPDDAEIGMAMRLHWYVRNGARVRAHLGAALVDGSEYRGRCGLSVAELRAWHRPRLEVLAESGPDVLTLETVPDTDEAEALVSLVSELRIPAWLTYNIEGQHTRAGQPIAESFALATDAPEIMAVGVNCCTPDDAAAAVPIAWKTTGKPVIVYPNSGEGWDGHQWVGAARFSGELAQQWVRAGARIVGGCCRVRPTDIADIARAVTNAG